jgi:hypothetical protein
MITYLFTFNFKSMKLFVKKIFVFSLLVIIIFILINFFQKKYNIEPEHFKKQYESILNSKNKMDGIIIGTSHATHSMRPSILDKSGVKFYNYALNGSNPEFYLKWYNNFIHNKIKVKYCLYSVDFFMFDDKDWLYRRFEHDSEYFPIKVFINELIFGYGYNKLDLIINRFPFLKYRNQIQESLRLKNGSKDCNVDNYDRGYISYTGHCDDFYTDLGYNIYPKQLTSFKLLIKQMMKDRVKIYFIVAPEYRIDPSKYNEMISLKIINSISKKFNIPVFNFNTTYRSDINNNINYFTDWGHMNHRGAKMFSEKLAKVLNNTFKTFQTTK